MKRLVAVLSLLSLMYICTDAQRLTTKQVAVGVEQIVKNYPKASLQDVYKSFFQDRFGPGHMINNRQSAENYLDSELKLTDTIMIVEGEPTGATGRFYRVDLGLIVKRVIPKDVFVESFICSANSVEPMPIEDWRQEWNFIISVIDSMDISLRNYEIDKEKISEYINSGKYVMHHSELYRESYDPHYRIIERSIYQKEILPYIEKQ